VAGLTSQSGTHVCGDRVVVTRVHTHTVSAFRSLVPFANTRHSLFFTPPLIPYILIEQQRHDEQAPFAFDLVTHFTAHLNASQGGNDVGPNTNPKRVGPANRTGNATTIYCTQWMTQRCSTDWVKSRAISVQVSIAAAHSTVLHCTSLHITAHHITSHHITSHHITAHHSTAAAHSTAHHSHAHLSRCAIVLA
jgi:hypothetical protein